MNLQRRNVEGGKELAIKSDTNHTLLAPDDPDLRQRLGTAGRARIIELYSVEALGRRLAQYLTEVAA